MNLAFVFPMVFAAWGNDALARTLIFDAGNAIMTWSVVYFVATRYGGRALRVGAALPRTLGGVGFGVGREDRAQHAAQIARRGRRLRQRQPGRGGEHQRGVGRRLRRAGGLVVSRAGTQRRQQAEDARSAPQAPGQRPPAQCRSRSSTSHGARRRSGQP
jgi:hypothetical protein